jgi:hypothetical protein
MRGGDKDDEETGGSSEEAISPYLKSNNPERRSVIPPSGDSFVFPSGKIARPAEDYLMPDDSRGEGGQDDAGEDGTEKAADAWLARGTSDDLDGTGMARVPRWVPWVALGGVGAGILVAALMAGLGGGSTPGESASPTESATPATPSFFDDGIAEDEYPAPVPWRGEGYPEARLMEDWVWNRTGPGWALVLFAEGSGMSETALPVPVVYLVSPEGVYFELTELPGRVADGATLVSWHEGEKTARIVWDHGTRGGLLSLETGEVDDTSFGLTAGRTKDIQFLAASADGREVWSAWGLDGLETRFYSWTSEAQWEWILSSQDDLHVEWYVNPTSPDSTAVALQIYTAADSLVASSRSLPPGVPNFVVYSLDTGENHRYIPAMPYATPNCWFTGWIDSTNVGFSCWDDTEGVQTDFRVYVDGSGRVEEDDGSGPWYSYLIGNETVQHPSEPIELVVDPDSAEVLGVSVLRDTESVPVVDLAMLGGSGHALSSFDEISPGVFRLVTSDNIVMGIDVETATAGPTIPGATSTGVPLMARSYVFFEEATPSGEGLNWGL